MRRDWSLIRKIMTAIEEMPPGGVLRPDDFDAENTEIVSAHLALLIEGGLVDGRCRQAGNAASCLAYRLTWDGHELLAGMRKRTVWNRVSGAIAERGLDLSYAAIRKVMLEMI